MTMDDLAARLRRLEDEQAIQRTQARYAACADAKYSPARHRVEATAMAAAAAGQAACFTEDACWDGGAFGGTIVGRAALAEWFARPPWHFALHYYVAPEIELSAQVAETRWRLWQVGLRENDVEPVLLAAITQQRFARQPDGAWLIARMRFEQIQIFPLSAGTLPAPVMMEHAR